MEVASSNQEAFDAWNGVLFDRWIEYREVVTDGLGVHGEKAFSLHPPPDGSDVLDIGCGLGDTTLRLAELVGPKGSVHGVDLADRMIEIARRDAEEAGAENVSFEAADVQATTFERSFDYAFSRMGTMFFAAPVPALRNVREALNPGGKLCMVVWRQKIDNHWLYRAEKVVEQYLEEPEETDEPTCGPGPFSMAGADTTSEILLGSGFTDVAFHRCDLPIKLGSDLDRAVSFVMALGPAGEAIRLAGDEADKIRSKLEREIREVLVEFDGPDGVWAQVSTWVVSARVPEDPAA